MRVIAGLYRGRRLLAPTWAGLRPSGDRLKGSLFGIVGEKVARARVLDLYAGSGALGIEALSRGAAEVVFVERDARAVKLLRANLERCGLAETCDIIRGDARAALARLAERRVFDLILIDPPYASEEAAKALAATAALGILAPGGWAVVEHFGRGGPAAAVGRLGRFRQARIGQSRVSFYADAHGGPSAPAPAR